MKQNDDIVTLNVYEWVEFTKKKVERLGKGRVLNTL